MAMMLARSSWGALLAHVNHLGQADVVFWAGVLLVFGCLIAAGAAAWRGVWPVVGLLVLVALVAAVIFF